MDALRLPRYSALQTDRALASPPSAVCGARGRIASVIGGWSVGCLGARGVEEIGRVEDEDLARDVGILLVDNPVYLPLRDGLKLPAGRTDPWRALNDSAQLAVRQLARRATMLAMNVEPATPRAHTYLNLIDVEDAAPANGVGEHWEARVARTALGSDHTGVSHFRLRPGKRSPFTHRHVQAEEIYVVLSGSGRVKLDDEFVDVRPLDAVRGRR